MLGLNRRLFSNIEEDNMVGWTKIMDKKLSGEYFTKYSVPISKEYREFLAICKGCYIYDSNSDSYNNINALGLSVYCNPNSSSTSGYVIFYPQDFYSTHNTGYCFISILDEIKTAGSLILKEEYNLNDSYYGTSYYRTSCEDSYTKSSFGDEVVLFNQHLISSRYSLTGKYLVYAR